MTYIGYSLGCTIGAMAMSNPEIGNFIKQKTEQAIFLGPYVYPELTEDKYFLEAPIEYLKDFQESYEKWEVHNWAFGSFRTDHSWMWLQLALYKKHRFCFFMSNLSKLTPNLQLFSIGVKEFWRLIFGPGHRFLDGISTKVAIHLYQLSKKSWKNKTRKIRIDNDKDNFEYFQNTKGEIIKKIEMRWYDHGNDKTNQEKYGTTKPPEYDLSTINIPVHFICGACDLNCNEKSGRYLADRVSEAGYGDIVQIYNIPYYKHVDFVMPYDVRPLHEIFDKIFG